MHTKLFLLYKNEYLPGNQNKITLESIYFQFEFISIYSLARFTLLNIISCVRNSFLSSILLVSIIK